MADVWAVFTAGALEADVLARAIFFADTEEDANSLAALYDNAFGATNAYDSYEIDDTLLTGGGTLTAVPGYPMWQYRNTGDDQQDQYRIEMIDALSDDSSGPDSSDEDSFPFSQFPFNDDSSSGANLAGPGGMP